MADDPNGGMTLPDLMNRMIDHCPEQAGLPKNVIGTHPAHLFTIRLEMIPHQQGLIQQILEIKRPVETLQARGKSGGMAGRYDHPALPPVRGPGEGKYSEGVLD